MLKIKIFIDPSHSNWILGGIFREIYRMKPNIFDKPKIISKLRSKQVISTLVNISSAIIVRKPIIFSSITPLHNFNKIWPFDSNLKLLWYTHSEVSLTKKTIKLLNKTNIIFVHSSLEKEKLKAYGVNSRIIPVIGAIRSDYFNALAITGDKIVWIGTSSLRKNAKLALSFAQKNPQLKFKFFVKDWGVSELAIFAKSLNNIEYSEISTPLKSEDFNGCSHHLILSEVEGGPISLLETLAAGLIPISTKVGFVEEVLCALGYEDQLLTSPINFDEIYKKYNKLYSVEFRKKISFKIKNYTYKSLSERIIDEAYEFRKTLH